MFTESYERHKKEREALGIPPLPLNKEETEELIARLKKSDLNETESEEYLTLLSERIPSGVDEAAQVKALFLEKIAQGEEQNVYISPQKAIALLGTMGGGYNIHPLIRLLENESVQQEAANALKHTILVFSAFDWVKEMAENGNSFAREVLTSWANAEWFLNQPEVPLVQKYTVFKVSGEINTDDLSPAPDAFSRPDIPLHALAMLKNARAGVLPDENGVRGPVTQISVLKAQGNPIAFVGDVVGTGSSRKSATNSVLWHIGKDLPFVPNKKSGGLCLGGKIAPIFFNTMEDSGALPIEINVEHLSTGDEIELRLDKEKNLAQIFKDEQLLGSAPLKTPVLLDGVRAGGRIPLIIGRALTAKARKVLNLETPSVFKESPLPDVRGVGLCLCQKFFYHLRKALNLSPAKPSKKMGYTLAQKIIGKACGLERGVLPGEYVEPQISSVGSQDTTGPLTRDELKDLACLNFGADLVMQSFCHTAAYPKPVDIETQKSLPLFFTQRGGVALKPMDGVIHSWLNRLGLPDTVGTGGDSHTRFPLGISFPAGSGLVAFAAATGAMPLDMPESVLVRFQGDWESAQKRGITLRDLVNAIPLYAIKNNLLTVEKENKKNIFSGRILEIEGLPHLKVEEAFELTDASAERSAAACTVALNREPVEEYLRSNAALIRSLIEKGYQNKATLERRLNAIEHWLEKGELLKADKNARYAAKIVIPLDEITEPIVACPNDPDDVKELSKVQGDKIDEVFIGSCMTNIGHFRAAAAILKNETSIPTRLWLAPPTRMDADELRQEGVYAVFGKVGARMEVPGCSLCMGNQAQIQRGSTAMSTSTRNFPNRLGVDTRVYLGSAELAAVCALLGKIPSVEEYKEAVKRICPEECYRYLNFHQMAEYSSAGAKREMPLVKE